MKKIFEAKKRLRDARCEADAILAAGANRLLLIEAILIVCVFAAMFVTLNTSIALLLSHFAASSDSLERILSYVIPTVGGMLTIFFAAPVVLGVFRLCQQMCADQEPVLMDMFYYLSTPRRYLQGLRITWLGSLKLVIAIAALNAISIIWTELTPDTLAFDILGGIAMVAVIGLYLLWLLFPYSKLYYLLEQNGAPIKKDAYLLAPRGGLRLIWLFLPWILLGILSVGILLLIDVLPRMMLTYFCDCKRKDTTTDL